MSSGQTSHPTTGSVLRSVLHGSSLYTVALLAQRLASFILLPVNTRFLTPADYGVMELLDQVIIVSSVLLGGGIGTAVGYFYAEQDSPEYRRRLLGTTIIGVLLLGLLTTLAGGALASPASYLIVGGNQFYAYILFVMATMPLIYLIETQFCWLRIENKASLYAGSSILRISVIVVGILTLVAGFKLGVWGVLFTNAIAMLVVVGFLSPRMFSEASWRFDRKLFTRMWLYSFPIGLSSIAVIIIHFGDRFILPHYRPLAELGIYALAYKLGMMLALIHTSFFSYWNAQVFIIMKREDSGILFQRIFTYFMLVFSMAALALVVGARPLLHLLTAPAYHGAISLVPVIVCAYYFRSIGDFFRVLFLVHNRPSLDAACNWIGAAICLTAYFSLIPWIGIWGAALATLIAFASVAVLSVVWAYRLHPFRIEGIRLLKITTVLAVLTAAYFSLSITSLWRQILWAIVLLAAYPALLWIWQFPTSSEKEQLRALLGRSPFSLLTFRRPA